jgi:hypothetical protein
LYLRSYDLVGSVTEHPVMHYVGHFNHMSQYAIEYVNTDRKKKNHFLRGLNTKLHTMMATSGNATYHETINIAIASEENYLHHSARAIGAW